MVAFLHESNVLEVHPFDNSVSSTKNSSFSKKAGKR